MSLREIYKDANKYNAICISAQCIRINYCPWNNTLQLNLAS